MPRQQDNDTETLILRAAEREFLAKGFSGARTTSIAEAAGVTHAMLHYYFRTKEKLFERIISEKIMILKDALLDSIGDMDAPLTEILRNIISKHLAFVAANPDIPRFLVGEIFSNPERLATYFDSIIRVAPSFIRKLQDKIDREAAHGLCRKVDAEMLMLDIVSLNVFAYMASPVVNAALGNCMADAETFLEVRKKENYDTIIRKITP